MTAPSGPITATWFLYSEDGQPLGQVNRRGIEPSEPAAGLRLGDGARWRTVEVVAFTELVPTCAIRRFKVVVRVLD